jgi:hypothetical protein
MKSGDSGWGKGSVMDYDSPFMMNERNDASLVGNCRSQKGGVGLGDE